MTDLPSNASIRPPPQTVGKLEAAQRQLALAIELWFRNRDPIPVYTLAHAAYEVIHQTTRDRRQITLLYDSAIAKDEYRTQWIDHWKRPANFFKHGLRGSKMENTITFHPGAIEAFLLFSIVGLRAVGHHPTDEEETFMYWVYLNRPETLTERGRQQFVDDVPPDVLRHLRGLTRDEFFDKFMNAWRQRHAADA